MKSLFLLISGITSFLFARSQEQPAGHQASAASTPAPARSFSQKLPLDHSVYDGWQSIGEKAISNDGKYIAWTVTPQEGDGLLVVMSADKRYKKEIPRGYNLTITEDSRWLVCRIRPFFKDTRDARIKKKKTDEMPKDSLAILELGKDSIARIPRVKNYKTPEKGTGWVAWLFERPAPTSAVPAAPATTSAAPAASQPRATPKPADSTEGTELILRQLSTGRETGYPLVSNYLFSKKGKNLVLATTRKGGDSLSKATVLWVALSGPGPLVPKPDTVMRNYNEIRNLALDEEGGQLAFVAERDSVTKALQKFYKLWYYKPGMDSARLRGDRHTAGVAAGQTISENYALNFSRDGSRLFIGLSPIRPPKDTTLVDFETARLDIWNYQDDYLQPQQLKQLDMELRKSWLAVCYTGEDKIIPLADDHCETVETGDEGNSLYAIGTSTKDYRIQQQWEESHLMRVWLVNTKDGTRRLVQDKVRGMASISPKGNFLIWYDWRQRHWFVYDVAAAAVRNITRDIKVPLYDEDDDHPDDPPPHGLMGWQEGDKYVYVYDRYDIWQCDPSGKEAPKNFTAGRGRSRKRSWRYITTNREEKFISNRQPMYFTVFDEAGKKHGTGVYQGSWQKDVQMVPFVFRGYQKAKDQETLIFTKESYSASPDLWVATTADPAMPAAAVAPRAEGARSAGMDMPSGPSGAAFASETQLSSTNPQQQHYNWYSTTLVHWKMFDGRQSEGLLYKPEDFDSTKKYPVILYFYERDADNLYNYIEPSPIRASINVAWFVSNGYIVFDPNIYYKNGQPGESAYNSVISAAKYLGRFHWVDTTRMGLQGHSWGGYQVAYLVTRTNMFAAAEAGAPVANMTSAYGGIRWGVGISRQFQYEHSQSRIGYTPWQRLDLYLKNSPLFRADKIKTPLLMMHNDQDGAVPWYQGIEYFSALKRLGKPVWMMQYNGEDHGLTERRNRKDWAIRMGQFFDHFLKGAPAARWISEGVPATLKGIDWGLGTGAAPGPADSGKP
ncbi:MAG TPA: prolyl oligopeptidase family serine peptidase [Puia sp.]|nr:prolyl oligopeptidase family serine peptidase [Puia sp.]